MPSKFPRYYRKVNLGVDRHLCRQEAANARDSSSASVKESVQYWVMWVAWFRRSITRLATMTPLSVIGIVVVGAIAFFLGTDPLKMSMGSGQKEFQAQYVAPPSVDPFQGFPRDDANKLQDAQIKWRGELFGPESLTFDPQGRGPYTGVSDGRVLRYDGPELGWTTFAYTSTNRSHIIPSLSPLLSSFFSDPGLQQC